MSNVILSKKAEDNFAKLPTNQKNKVNKKLFSLTSDPYSGKKLKGEYAEYYSLKAWPYRIIYFIMRNGNIWVTSILHRQGAYK